MKGFFGWILYIFVCLCLLIILPFLSKLITGHFTLGLVIAIALVFFLGWKFPARRKSK